MHHEPIVAWTIRMRNTADGPGYAVYDEAYGVEMTIDDEWPIESIAMAPPHLVSCLTKWADLPSMGVQTGASYYPGDGNLEQIVESGGAWVLSRPSEDLSKIAALNLGAILYLDTSDALPPALAIFVHAQERVMIAWQMKSTTTLADAQAAASEVKSQLRDRGLPSVRFLLSGAFDPTSVLPFLSLNDVDGVLMLDAQGHSMVELIIAVAADVSKRL